MFNNEKQKEKTLTSINPRLYGNTVIDNETDCYRRIPDGGLNAKYNIIIGELIHGHSRYNQGENIAGSGNERQRKIYRLTDPSKWNNKVYTTPIGKDYYETLQNVAKENHMLASIETMRDCNFPVSNPGFTKNLKVFNIEPQNFASFHKTGDNSYTSTGVIESISKRLYDVYPGDDLVEESVNIINMQNGPYKDKEIVKMLDKLFKFLTSRAVTSQSKVGDNVFYVDTLYFQSCEHNDQEFLFDRDGEPSWIDHQQVASVTTNGMTFKTNEMHSVTEIKNEGPDGTLVPQPLPQENQPIYKVVNLNAGPIRLYLNTHNGIVIETPDKDIETIKDRDSIRVFYGGNVYNANAIFDKNSKTLEVSFKDNKDQHIVCSPTSKNIYQTQLSIDSLKMSKTVYNSRVEAFKEKIKSNKRDTNGTIQLTKEDKKTLAELDLEYLSHDALRGNIIQNLTTIERYGNMNPICSPMAIPSNLYNSIDIEHITDAKAKEIIKDCPQLEKWIGNIPDTDNNDEKAKTVRIQFAKEVVDFIKTYYDKFNPSFNYIKYGPSGEEYISNNDFTQISKNIKIDHTKNTLLSSNEVENDDINFIQKELNSNYRYGYDHGTDAARKIFKQKTDEKTGKKEINEQLMEQYIKQRNKENKRQAIDEKKIKKQNIESYEQALKNSIDTLKTVGYESFFVKFFRFLCEVLGIKITTKNYTKYEKAKKQVNEVLKYFPNGTDEELIKEAVGAVLDAAKRIGDKSINNDRPILSLENSQITKSL